MSRAIYVETRVRADMETLWSLTQDAATHPRWDLRFSSITPIAALSGGGTRFRYARRIPFHTITGDGTSIGEVLRPDGSRTSALRFDTADRWSPLRDGRGYWRYVPTGDGIRFITGYDYEPGFGRLADLIIRPFVRWMTAWSFDRLRIWAETGVEPERWPVASVIAVWRPGRPKASRCTVHPPARGAMHDAPDTLTSLEAP